MIGATVKTICLRQAGIMNRNKIKSTVSSSSIVALLGLLLCAGVFVPTAALALPDEHHQDTYAIDALPGSGTSPYTLDQEKLAGLVSAIDKGNYGNTHSLIIIQNDNLVLEKYFQGWTRDMRHPCFSVTKSVTSALIGIALAQGKIKGLDAKLLSFFSEYSHIRNVDEKKQSITLENVLTMTTGLEWNELSTPYTFGIFPNFNNDMIRMLFSRDYIKYVIDQPMASDPGTEWLYNSGSLDLLSGIITNTTGQSAEDFAADNLFHPMGITDWAWVKGPNDISETGAGLSLHPVDMAMFGYLYLKKGLLKGEQIIPAAWVETSTAKRITDIMIFGQKVYLYYGYLWWIAPVNATVGKSLRLNEIYCALGYGGQCIFIIPPLDMVVVSTAVNLDDLASMFSGFKFLSDYILPAVKEK